MFPLLCVFYNFQISFSTLNVILKYLYDILIYLVTKLGCCVQVLFNPRELQKHPT